MFMYIDYYLVFSNGLHQFFFYLFRQMEKIAVLHNGKRHTNGKLLPLIFVTQVIELVSLRVLVCIL